MANDDWTKDAAQVRLEVEMWPADRWSGRTVLYWVDRAEAAEADLRSATSSWRKAADLLRRWVNGMAPLGDRSIRSETKVLLDGSGMVTGGDGQGTVDPNLERKARELYEAGLADGDRPWTALTDQGRQVWRRMVAEGS